MLPKDNNTPTQLPLREPSLGFGFSQEEPFYRFVVSESEAQFTVNSSIVQVFFLFFFGPSEFPPVCPSLTPNTAT